MKPVSPRILLVQNLSVHPRRLAKFLQNYGAVTKVSYRKLDEKLAESFDIIVLSGGHPQVLGHSKQFKHELDFLRSTERPVIGICLGFELIVRAHGGSLHKLPHKQHGLTPIIAIDPAFAPGGPAPIVFESHRWGVKDLPTDLIALASTSNGVELIKHSAKPIYGCQFHPEVTRPSNHGQVIFERLLAQIF